MNVRRVITFGVPLLVGLVVAVLWPAPKLSPEDEVRAVFASLAVAADKRDVSAIADTLDDGFRGPAGGRQETKQLIAAVLLRSAQGVSVVNPSLGVQIETPTTATFNGTFVFAQGTEGTAMQATDGVAKYEIGGKLEKRDGVWRFVSADWRR